MVEYEDPPAVICDFQMPSYLALFPHRIKGMAVVVGSIVGDFKGVCVKELRELTEGLREVNADTDIVCVVASDILGVILAVPVPVGVLVLDGVSVPVGESLGSGGGSGDD